MKKATIRYTRHVDGTTYMYPSWWAFGDDGHPIAGGCASKRDLAHALADLNLRVRVTNSLVIPQIPP